MSPASAHFIHTLCSENKLWSSGGKIQSTERLLSTRDDHVGDHHDTSTYMMSPVIPLGWKLLFSQQTFFSLPLFFYLHFMTSMVWQESPQLEQHASCNFYTLVLSWSWLRGRVNALSLSLCVSLCLSNPPLSITHCGLTTVQHCGAVPLDACAASVCVCM